MSRFWKIEGLSQGGRSAIVTVRAADYNEAARIAATRHKLVVRDVVLLDEQPPEVLQALAIRARLALLDERLTWIDAAPRDKRRDH
jgi:hypothetical protein